MQNLSYLIERRQVFYCKALSKRAIYLSLRAYQLLKRIRTQKALTPEARTILDEMKGLESVEKDELRKKLDMDSKTFGKAFDFLLENLYITACAGKKLNVNWYSYLYCTAEQFERDVQGLHFNGNAKEELWRIVGQTMDEKSFAALCK